MTTTTNDGSAHEQLAKRRTYRRLFVASILAGVGGFLVASFAGYTLVGVAVYWAGALGMLAVGKWSPVELFDEREQELELRAGAVTLGLFALVLIAGAPGLVALEEAGVYSAPPVLWGAMWGFAAMYLVFGAVYTVYRYRA